MVARKWSAKDWVRFGGAISCSNSRGHYAGDDGHAAHSAAVPGFYRARLPIASAKGRGHPAQEPAVGVWSGECAVCVRPTNLEAGHEKSMSDFGPDPCMRSFAGRKPRAEHPLLLPEDTGTEQAAQHRGGQRYTDLWESTHHRCAQGRVTWAWCPRSLRAGWLRG